ncbi:tetratricopeptide repeat protein [Phaeocystidibacter marisrubri]|uniref:Tetratricopeptide repeat protein n=1 Tax=Phaeocystidibacter marisrubri TaxID=1577780 RepID=A0A6L3ZDJ3_9FLAO|nr:tetratricopeptide repeat protein [Phaeocystidibacter marisrubri]KAB2815901.1 tetratricopeptide repeat protein [Phaeocystidibacter marisrubri]GGH66307.1 hypothetical protein GCM10011318_04130 [Phaeocystidibacter marisrubri]
MRYLTIAIFSLLSLLSSAQVKLELAEQAMEEGRFEDAIKDYLDLYKSHSDDVNYNYVLDCYIALKDWRSGERFIEKHIDNSRNRLGFYKIDRAFFLQNIPDTSKAEKVYNEVLEEVNSQPGIAYQYSERAKKWGVYRFALAVLETAEQSDPRMQFSNQKASIYAELGMLEEMYSAYLDVLERTPNFLLQLQNIIRFNMNREGEIPISDVLKRDVLVRIREGGPVELNKFLIWILTQEGQYTQAFTQAKALYLRGSYRAIDLLQLGNQAVTAKDFRGANRVFDYIIQEGDKTPFEQNARYALLKSKFTQLQAERADTTQFEELLATCYDNIDALRGSQLLADTYLLMAEVQYGYLHKNEDALESIAKCENSASPNNSSVVSAQLLKGDIQLAMGLPYDAILTYAQVESNHDSSPMGQEARFRKGRVAFYTGKFEWAENTFYVLKHSTSKLIANDAMRYSLLIKDNAALDTTYVLLERYAKVLLLQAQNRYSDALLALDTLDGRLSLAVSDHPLKDEALFTRAELLSNLNKNEEAATLYERVAANFPKDLLADQALIRAARICLYTLKDETRAKNLYEKVLLEHSNSIYAEEARQEYRKLRGDTNT